MRRLISHLVVKATLRQQFQMKDLGPLRYFLGIEVAYSPREYFLSQQKYVIDLLSRVGCSMMPLPTLRCNFISS